MPGRRGNGEGSVFQRLDGRWVGQGTVQLIGGGSKRITVTGSTRSEANSHLQARLGRNRDGYRTAQNERTVAEFLEHWIEEIVPLRARPTTVYDYKNQIRLYIRPGVGRIPLAKLSPQDVQRLVNNVYAKTGAARTTAKTRAVLRAALSHAEQQELVARNVATKVTLPRYEPKPITPWTPLQSQTFLDAIRGHRWYGAFLISCIYGARRGEVLGLSWNNIDFHANTIRFGQQLLRIDKTLQLGPVKTKAGQRTLPLATAVREELLSLLPDAPHGTALDTNDGDGDLVFRATPGTPIDPKVFTRAFYALCEKHGLPHIRLHDLRHTAATLLKKLGVPDRDIQHILGHAHVTTTQQIYQHGDNELQADALNALGSLILQQTAAKIAAQPELSTGQGTKIPALTPGTPGWIRTNDTWFRSQSHDTFYNDSTPVMRTLPNAPERLKPQQTADIFAALAAHPAYVESDSEHHVSCPLGHDTDWLIRELAHRLRDKQAGGDLAA